MADYVPPAAPPPTIGITKRAELARARRHGTPGTPVTITLQSGDAACTANAILPGVHYMVVATVDCFLKMGSTATANTDFYLPAKVPMLLKLIKNTEEGGAAGTLHAAAGGAGYLTATPMTE